MSTRAVTSCDVCGAEKKETNHWWAVWLFEGEFRMAPFKMMENSNVEGVKDVCGSKHVMTILERYLDHGSLDEETEGVMPLKGF